MLDEDLAFSVLLLPKSFKSKSDGYIGKAVVAKYSRYKEGLDAWLGANKDVVPTSDTVAAPFF